MKTEPPGRRDRSLAPLVTATVAAMVFTILLIAVRLQWAPLESADHGAAADLNRLIAGNATAVAARRTPGLTHWSEIFSTLGATQAILIVTLATCVVFLAVTRRWRPVVFVATVMAGELGAFLVAAAVVHRPRP